MRKKRTDNVATKSTKRSKFPLETRPQYSNSSVGDKNIDVTDPNTDVTDPNIGSTDSNKDVTSPNTGTFGF